MTHFDLATTLAQPDRWDTDHPALYTATVEVIAEDKLRDADSVVFGIRDAHFEAATGFWINGRNIKLLGVCLHEGAGAFGIAVPAEIYRDRLVALKALGVNAIRTSHNPPSPEFLALCDQLGLFVMDEAFDMWSVGKNPFDYHLDFPQDHVRDTMSIALRDRNHPSIVLWSAGNEIRDTKQSEIAKPELRTILDAFHAVDPSRPVTEALVQSKLSHDYEDGLADMLDVIGQNYRPDEIVEAHTDKPSRKIIGTENGQNLNEWLPVRDNAAYAGEFLWTGEDYLGEAHTWPAISHSTGLIDRTGGLHARGLERSSWWSTQPVVFLVRHVPGGVREKFAAHDIETAFADWTPNSLAPHDEQVDVYSNCSAVTLSLNGASLGSKPRNADDTPRTWLVHFAPGAITALCGDNRTAITLKTAGPADHIQLTSLSDHVGTTFDDATELRAVIVDAAGIPVPRAANLLHFTVEGPAKILAVDNADNISHEPFQATQRFAYEGTAVAYIRATGSGIIHITADAANLHAGVATIQAIQ
jgi:beta-galactosidase